MVSIKESPKAVGLTEEDLLDIYHNMLLARALSERMWILNRMGRAPFAITCDGHEACQVASAYGSGNFINVLHEHLSDQGRLVTTRVNNKDDIYDSIKRFFAAGR